MARFGSFVGGRLVAKTLATDSAQSGPDLRAMIAEAAYFKAEKRGFMPGLEMDDWLDAERELSATAAMLADVPRRKTKSAPERSKKDGKKKSKGKGKKKA